MSRPTNKVVRILDILLVLSIILVLIGITNKRILEPGG